MCSVNEKKIFIEALLPKNSICFLVSIEPNDTAKSKCVRRKDLLLPGSKENTRDLSQGNISLKSKTRKVLC